MSARRTSKPAREAASYAVGDIVLGKVRGYAPWPGMVVDPENVPQTVADDRPKSSKTTFYCVRFFPNNDYSWLVEKDISRLKPHEISAFLAEPTKKKGDLFEAYKTAQDPKSWIEEMDRKAKEALERQGEVDEEDEEDQLESDSASTSVKSKKRKRTSEAANAVKKLKKATTASAKGGRNGAKSKATVESEDEHGPSASGVDDAGPSTKKGVEPPAKKQKKDDDDEEGGANQPESTNHENIRVKDWRHKLQKIFLGKVPPKDEDMPDVDALFKTVEKTEVGIEGLQYSKIGKVMRHIAALDPTKVPRDAEFKFRERAKALVERWQGVLNAAKVPGGTNGEAKTPKDVSSPPKAHSDDDGNAKEGEKVPTATATAIAAATTQGGDVKTFEGQSTSKVVDETKADDADMDAPGEKDVDAHGEADAPGEVDALGEVVGANVQGVQERTAKIDLNGTVNLAITNAHPPVTSGATATQTTGDVEMADAA